MTLSSALINGTYPGTYVWTIHLCVNERTEADPFRILMPYPPTAGRSIEFYGTPEGSFIGTIFRVHEVVNFEQCSPIVSDHSFGYAQEVNVQPSIIQFQVSVNVEKSDSLSLRKSGVPSLE